MANSQYRGARRPDQRGSWNTKGSAGLMSAARKAWASLPKFDAILFVGDTDDSEESTYNPDTPPVRIDFRTPGRRYSTRISLTLMTTAELDVFKQFMDNAFERARPICELLDQRAQEAFENGDDSHVRLYRPDPQFFNRELPPVDDNQWRKPEHDPSISSGSEGTGQPSAEASSSGEGITGTSDSELPDGEPSVLEAEHDEP